MNISRLTQEQLTKFYKDDEKLSQIALPDDELKQLKDGQLLTMGPGEVCLGITHKNELISILRLNTFTPVSAIVHCCVSSKWHKKGMSKIVKDVYLQHLADVTKLVKVVCPAPSTCKHAINALEYSDFKKEATFKNIMPWRGEIVDLIWYSHELTQYREHK